MEPEIYDYGSDPRDENTCWVSFLKNHVKNSKGWIVVSVQWEDKVYYIYRCKSEKEAKKEYLSNIEETESHDDDYVYHDGKPVQIRKTVEFIGIDEPLEEMS